MSACVECQTPLVIEVASDSELAVSNSNQTQSIPDDLRLPCGCHFHWQCYFDICETSQCPHCSTELISLDPSTRTPKVLSELYNEGGQQSGLDILPETLEQVHLRAHPEEERCQAFLSLCRQGDVQAIADLLAADDDESDDRDGPAIRQKSRDEILRYQNPLGNRESGLHAAIAGGSREVAWMLLLLASNLPELEFPALVYQEALALNLMRTDQTRLTDIRTLKDGEGRTPGQLAQSSGPIWQDWAERLAVL